MSGDVRFIFGGSLEDRVEMCNFFVTQLLSKGLSNNPDYKTVDLSEGKKSIGIQEAKDAAKFLDQKPFQEKHKVLVFTQSDKLTEEAQNSLLKTLEEPPVFATIVLLAPSQSDLLETVVSRCKKIEIRKTEIKSSNHLNKFWDWQCQNIEQKFLWAEKVAKEDKEIILEEIFELILGARSALHKYPSAPLATVIDDLSLARQQLRNININTRLLLEAIAIKTSIYQLPKPKN